MPEGNSLPPPKRMCLWPAKKSPWRYFDIAGLTLGVLVLPSTHACYFIRFVQDKTPTGVNRNDHDACSVLLPVAAGRCVCPGDGCSCSLINFHPSCSDSNNYRQEAASATQAVSTRPLTVVQYSLVNVPGQVAQPGSVHTVQQQVNWRAQRAAVMLMCASASEEVHSDTSISRLKVDPNKTVFIGDCVYWS